MGSSPTILVGEVVGKPCINVQVLRSKPALRVGFRKSSKSTIKKRFMLYIIKIQEDYKFSTV